MRARARRFALVGLMAACLGPPATGDAPEHPDFSGSWELNEERSDDLSEVVDQAMRGRSDPPPTGRAGRGPSGAGDSRQALREQLDALIARPRVITIRQLEPELTIESALPDRPFRQSVYLDGRRFAWAGAGGDATAGWRRGGRLVVESALGSGRPVTETWELVAEGSRILVATEIAAKGLSPAIRVQRVYDRVEIVPWAVPD